jgi:Domain of unknown function (DUF4416)
VGTAASPQRSLLIISVLGRSAAHVGLAIERLEQQLGELLYISAQIPFDWTDYYEGELGQQPVRRFVAFRALVDPSRLPKIKRATGRLEIALSRPGEGRAVNIDPGILNAHQLVLASTKSRRHRIYLSEGIYADLMLLFDGGCCSSLPWTYADYADADQGRLLLQLRELYLSLQRERHAGAVTAPEETRCTP